MKARGRTLRSAPWSVAAASIFLEKHGRLPEGVESVDADVERVMAKARTSDRPSGRYSLVGTSSTATNHPNP